MSNFIFLRDGVSLGASSTAPMSSQKWRWSSTRQRIIFWWTKKSRCDQLVILPTPPFEKDLAFLRRFVPLLKLDNARGQDWLTKYCIIFLVDKKFLEWVPFQRGVRTGIQKENSIMTTILEGSTILEESSLWCEYSFDFRYKTNHL